MGLADAKLYQPYHEAFTNAGFAVLWQLDDWRNAFAYMRCRDDVDAKRGAIFGSGGTGGGNAVLVGAAEPDARATISQVPVADGRDWLHRMRQEREWVAFLDSVEADRRARATTGKGTTVHPRDGIMIETAERRATAVKADVDARTPTAVPLASAQGILEYRPIDAAPRARNLMVIAVADDNVTPTDHAEMLYEAARPPKRLVIQQNTTHYAAYKLYADEVIPLMVDWLRAHVLRDGDAAANATGARITYIGGSGEKT
jgi:fermentation-respiration switch protein FrsA (DUF1100 family)